MPRMGRKAAYITFTFVTILLVSNAILLYILYTYYRSDPVKDKIKRIIMSNYSYLTPKEHEIVTKLAENSEPATILAETFPTWENVVSKFAAVCRFGTRVLQHYAIYSDKKYLQATVNIINAINNKVLSNVKLEDVSSVWNINSLSEECARFLVAYQYLGDDSSNDSTNLICYGFILKLVPEFNKMKNATDNTVIYGNIARLLTLYVNNNSTYNSDMSSKEMESFKKVIKPMKNSKAHGSLLRFHDYYNDMFLVLQL